MVELRHRPFGWGHPYENGPDERVPRKPIVGQSIELRCVSSPDGALKKVWWQWQTTGAEPCYLEAERLLSTGDHQSNWAAILTPPNQITRITYELWGETVDSDTIFGGEFSADILDWVSPSRITGIREVDRVLQIQYALDFLDQSLFFNYWLNKEMDLIIDHFSASHAGKTTYPHGAWVRKSSNEKEQTWQNGSVKITINLNALTLEISSHEDIILSEEKPFEVLVSVDQEIHQFRRLFTSNDDEVVLGLGERFNALNQKGNSLDTRVFEQYRHQGDKTYIPIPFFLNSSGYGWFQNSSRRAYFDFPGNTTNPMTIAQETEDDFSGQSILFFDRDLEKIVRKFAKFIAPPELPPVWAFGLWMSSNEWYHQAEVNRQVELMKQHGIPATVLVIEAWSDEENFYIWNDAKYKPIDPEGAFELADFDFPEDGKWPDPKAMTTHLHDEGLKLILWQIPVLKHLFPNDLALYGENPQHDLDEAFMIKKGYCVKNADGSPYRVPPIWFSNSLVLDVTNPAAVDWWLSKRRYLVEEIGVDGFKTDGGEHLWGEDLQFFDGRTNKELWNEFPVMYEKSYYEFAKNYRDGDAVTFSRAGYTGSQSAPCHWAGDQVSTWEAFKAVLLAGQNLGISGVPFWGWDIGGFSGPIPSAELYLRSTAAAAFAPVMQYHSEHNQHGPISVDRTPWNMQEQTGDNRVLPAFRKFANLRMNLLPYLYSEAVFSSQSGAPLFGSPFVRFNDKMMLEFPYQFLCGRHLLVAPVVEPEFDEWKVYLPEGRWVDFWTGTSMEGGQVISTKPDLATIPVYVREGTILPFNLNTDLEFGTTISNRLDHYTILAAVMFGDSHSFEPYHWHDYITKKDFVLDQEQGSIEKSDLLTSVCEKIVSFTK